MVKKKTTKYIDTSPILNALCFLIMSDFKYFNITFKLPKIDWKNVIFYGNDFLKYYLLNYFFNIFLYINKDILLFKN
jgi:hypothetical protein